LLLTYETERHTETVLLVTSTNYQYCLLLGRHIYVGGQIPDASLIHLARKRRQLARERGDEFIPIDSGAGAAHEKKSSRLIR